jgi:hypothetical protein
MRGTHDVINIIDHQYQTDRNIQDMASTHPWNKPGSSSWADHPLENLLIVNVHRQLIVSASSSATL